MPVEEIITDAEGRSRRKAVFADEDEDDDDEEEEEDEEEGDSGEEEMDDDEQDESDGEENTSDEESEETGISSEVCYINIASSIYFKLNIFIQFRYTVVLKERLVYQITLAWLLFSVFWTVFKGHVLAVTITLYIIFFFSACEVQ